jgi:tRNA1Val (adenine37-N6)-methyltransferase
MKVGTDGVLLGAWAGEGTPSAILDVGTGTGLIALMLAQRFPEALVHAVEADGAAARQALENVLSSPWPERIRVFHSLFQEFQAPGSSRYDLIVSNPPFFRKSLNPPARQRSIARHDSLLPWEELITKAAYLLSDDGSFQLILPFPESELFVQLSLSEGLYCNRAVKVFSVPGKLPQRILLSFSRIKKDVEEGALIIEKYGRHGYSEEYRTLTAPFYLKM